MNTQENYTLNPLLLIFLSTACTVGNQSPSTMASPSATAVAETLKIADQAALIEQLARDLESEVDEVRRRTDAGDERAKQIEILREKMDVLLRADTALQAQVDVLKDGLRADHGENKSSESK